MPEGVHEVTFDVYGAQGGRAADTNAEGGLGGRATATFAVSPGAEYQVNVGGAGGQSNYLCPSGCANGG